MNLNKIYLAYNHLSILIKDKIYNLPLKKDILSSGIIINNELFIKTYLKFFGENKLGKLFWTKKVEIIYNCEYHQADINNLENIFRELNYKDIRLICEKNILKYNKKNNFLVIDCTHRLFYIDKYNTKKVLVMDNEILSNQEIGQLIKNRSNKKTLYVIGKIDNSIMSDNIEYYYYENIDEFFLKNVF